MIAAVPALRRWGPGLLWLGAWPVAGGLSQALLQGPAVSICGFQALTGCPCPLCGGTHLVQALTRWDWAAAWQAQPGLLPLLLVAWLLLGERPHGAALLRVALALLGLWIVLKPADAPWPVPQDAADVLALLGGLCFAATNVGLFKLRHSPEPARMMAMFGGGAVIPALVALGGSSLGLLAAPPALGAPWWPALVLALGFLVGNLTLQYGAARLSAHTTSLVMLSEVVFAAVSSVALGAAQWQTQTLVGGGLILLAALLAVQPAPARPAP